MEIFKDVKIIFEYFNGGVYSSFLLFIIATVYIWFTEKNKVIKSFFSWYNIIIFFIIWNPFAIKLFNKFINYASLYRVYYMLPLYITIAYAFTKCIDKRKNTVLKVIIFCSIIVFIWRYYEDNIFLSHLYEYNNFYKLPDETIKVADIIYYDKTYEEKKAIVPYGMSSQIQQVHYSIKLLYTRFISNPVDENGNPSPYDVDDPSGYEPIRKINEGDTKYIDNLCEKNNINYVVLSRTVNLQEPMENYNFKILDVTEENIVYIREK